MIPLIPTLALSILSFLSSAFIILYLVIPALPPHPLSNRVSRQKVFGSPTLKSLAPVDKAHVWLAVFDLLAMAIFLWEAFVEYFGGPSDFRDASHTASSLRLWLALTIRQACLFVIVVTTLLYVRSGKPVSYGSNHWFIWAPTLVIAVTSTSLAGVMTGAGVKSLFIGIVSYSIVVAVLSMAALACLIHRNVASPSLPTEARLEVKEKQHRQSFVTEDVEALKDGSSWITSDAGSRRTSISAFSFSTTHSAGTARTPMPVTASHPSLPAISSLWFTPAASQDGRLEESLVPSEHVPPPPVAPLAIEDHDDSMGSQHDSSWLTEPAVSQTTMSSWSFPRTCADSRMLPSTIMDVRRHAFTSQGGFSSIIPIMSSNQVLGGCGNAPTAISLDNAEKDSRALFNSPPNGFIVSLNRTIGWFALICLPLGFSLPYLLMVTLQDSIRNTVTSIFFILSVMLSAPLLAFNVIVSPLPVPSGLFEDSSNSPPPLDLESRYKRSGSVTVVECRRSGDVWLTKGDAINSNGKLSRATTLLSSVPKLSVLPRNPDSVEGGRAIPPLFAQDESVVSLTFVALQSEDSAEMDCRSHRNERDGCKFSTMDECDLAPAKTMGIARSSDELDRHPSITSMDSASFTTNLETILDVSTNSSRPVSSIIKSIIDKPRRIIATTASPLLQLTSLKPSGQLQHNPLDFSSDAVGNTNEIDSLSAKLLPLLVPGLKIGANTKVQATPEKMRPQNLVSYALFSSPELTTTPPYKSLRKKSFEFKRRRMSLPSLSPKFGVNSLVNWKTDVFGELVTQTENSADDGGREVLGGCTESESLRDAVPRAESLAQLRPAASMRKYGCLYSGQPEPNGTTTSPCRDVSVCTRLSYGIPTSVNAAYSPMATLIVTLETSKPVSSRMTFTTAIDPLKAESTFSNDVAQSVHALTLTPSATRLPFSTHSESDKSSESHASLTRQHLGRGSETRTFMAKAKTNAKLDKAKSFKIHNGTSGPRKPSLVRLRLRDMNVVYGTENSSPDSPHFGGKYPFSLESTTSRT